MSVILAGMTLRDLPADKLLKMLRATETAKHPDRYALDALRREVERRLQAAEVQTSEAREARP